MPWQEIRRRHMRAVPKGSSFDAYQRALRAASAEYHGRSASGRRPTATNPGAGNLVRFAALGLIAWWLVQRSQKPNVFPYLPPVAE